MRLKLLTWLSVCCTTLCVMELISTAEVAQRLGIHHYSVCRIIRDGRLRAQKIGKSWVVRSDDVAKLAKTYEGRPGRPKKHKAKDGRAA